MQANAPRLYFPMLFPFNPCILLIYAISSVFFTPIWPLALHETAHAHRALWGVVGAVVFRALVVIDFYEHAKAIMASILLGVVSFHVETFPFNLPLAYIEVMFFVHSRMTFTCPVNMNIPS